MKHLVLVLDASGSMNEKDQPFLPIRFAQLKDEVQKIVKSLDEQTTIHLYRFAQTAQHEGTWKEKTASLDALQSLWPFGGGTDIWGCLDMVADKVSEQNLDDALVLCVTDGEDGYNRIHRDEVEAKFASLPNVQLRVLVLNTQMQEIAQPDDSIIRRIRSLDMVATEVEKILPPRAAYVSPDQLAVRLPIYPLIPVDSTRLARLQGALAEIVPFLEKLTGLRYYPVPTYVVDHQSIRELCPVTLPDDDGAIMQDIEEISRFIAAVCITFHVGCFQGNFNNTPSGLNPRENDYADWLPPAVFPDEYRYWLRGQAEAVHCAIHDYASGHPARGSYQQQTWDESLLNPIQIADSNAWLFSISRTLRHILKALELMARSMPNGLFLDEQYFGATFKGYRDRPQLMVWKKHLSRQDSRTLENCIESDGRWKKDIRSITAMFRIAVKVILQKLPEARAMRSKHAVLIRQIRTRGMYMPPSVQSQEWLSKRLRGANFPEWFQPAQTGFVLLCMDDCIDSCAWQDSPGFTDRFLGSILTHEHAHAVCREGIGNLAEHSPWKGSTAEESAVSETLAEWAELEHSRLDAELFELVSDHAMCGTFPQWPYAGAILMERLCSRQGLKSYKRTLDLWRRGDSAAYKMLVKAE